ncbi:unnamed protein product [Ectocarpus sp. 12 AP-2014]
MFIFCPVLAPTTVAYATRNALGLYTRSLDAAQSVVRVVKHREEYTSLSAHQLLGGPRVYPSSTHGRTQWYKISSHRATP